MEDSEIENKLFEAILAIYPDIERRVDAKNISPSESELWYELSCCLLSSQVPYNLACAAALAISERGVLVESYFDGLTYQLEQILISDVVVENKKRSYRFPASRAKQIERTKLVVESQFGTLTKMLEQLIDPWSAREWLVDNALGIGPKQASMFLRNTGFTYDLAVIDRHVLNYMSEMELSDGGGKNISKLSGYCEQEKVLREHAIDIGAHIGMLDWAIWIVMRVKNQSSFNKQSIVWI